MELINLSNENKNKIKSVLQGIKRVDFSIDSIIDLNMCNVFVDNAEAPQAYMVQNGIFRIFAGKPSPSLLKSFAETLSDCAIVLPSSSGWFEFINTSNYLVSEVVNRFTMNSDSLNIKDLHDIPLPDNIIVRRVTVDDAKNISSHQDFSYHLQNFNDHNDFIKRGVGYVALNGKAIVGVASSALVCSKGIEVNIMVSQEFRCRGVALALGAKLVSNTIEQNLLANWDAGNVASKHLAQKLGYTSVGNYEALKVIPASLTV